MYNNNSTKKITHTYA